MTLFLAILGGLAGAALGWITVAGLALAITGYLGYSDFEGARAMSAVFGFGPIGGLVGLVTGVLVVLRMRRGRLEGRDVAIKLPTAILAIAALVSGAFWVAYEHRPHLNDNGPAPELRFEIRLPPGPLPATAHQDYAVTLYTEQNSMPGGINEAGGRLDGDRPVIVGQVEMHYRSSWRLLALKVPGEPERIFHLKLAARPGHQAELGGWERVAHVAVEGQSRPRPAGPEDQLDVRYRVAWPGAE